MKNILKYLAIIAVLSYLFYQLTIQFLPNLIYARLYIGAKAIKGVTDNEITYNPLPTDKSRAVVMPNPDFSYVSCFYDVSEGPLRLTGNLPDSSYWSVSFYQPNTINWYIKNDRQYGTNQLELILGKEGKEVNNIDNKEIAYSPTDKGFLLIRILVTDDDPAIIKKYESWQKSVKLEMM